MENVLACFILFYFIFFFSSSLKYVGFEKDDVFSVCRTYTQHSVSSLNAGDSPNDQKSPEEGPEKKKERKSEALNIRGIAREYTANTVLTLNSF